MVATPLFALEDFAQDRFVLAWRVYLTELITSAFFANEAYYRVVHIGSVDNPDQRIAQDVSQFVSTSARVINTLVSKLFNCIAFAGAWSAHGACQPRV